MHRLQILVARVRNEARVPACHFAMRCCRRRNSEPVDFETYSHSIINEPLKLLICNVPASASQIFTVTSTVNLSRSSIGAGFRAIGPKVTFRDLSTSIDSWGARERFIAPRPDPRSAPKLKGHQIPQLIVAPHFSDEFFTVSLGRRPEGSRPTYWQCAVPRQTVRESLERGASPRHRPKDADPWRELGSEFPVRDSDVVLGLQVQPEPGLHAEEQPEPNRGVRGDGALATCQLADPLGETSMSAASWRALIPMGFMKSSSRISPG